MSINKLYNDLQYHDNITDITELYIRLINNSEYDLASINFYMYAKYNYVFDNSIKELKTKRIGQMIFKKQLIDRYKVCLISKVDSIVCDACHIIEFSKCNINDKYNINNGILLRKDLHKLFDDKKLIIKPDTLTIQLTDDITQNPNMSEYLKFNNIKIDIDINSINYLKKFYND